MDNSKEIGIGLDAIPETDNTAEDKAAAPAAPKPRPFVVWTVGEGEEQKEYRLKLTNQAIARVEDTLKRPLLDACFDDGIPRANTFVTVLHGAMLKFNHGIDGRGVSELIDKYLETHTRTDLMIEVLLPLMQDAGFFTVKQLKTIQSEMREAAAEV